MKFIIKFNHHPSKKHLLALHAILKDYHVRSLSAFDHDQLMQIEVDEAHLPDLYTAIPDGFEIYPEHQYKVPTTKKSINDQP